MIKHMQLIVRPYIYTPQITKTREADILICVAMKLSDLKKKRFSHRRIPSACNVMQKRNVFLFLKF